MQNEFIIAIARNRSAQLPESPVRGWMSGRIEINQLSGLDLKSNEYMKDTEVSRDGDEEITRNNFARMVPEEC
ncbi:MAG TPA: hypothetical protein VGE93_22950 [Bryobacteraceae bacterium]